MKKLCLLFIAMLMTALTNAAPIGKQDIGSYVVLKKNKKPSKMVFRLSKEQTKWDMESKQPDGSWKSTLCSEGCQFKKVSASEATSYLPKKMHQTFDINCIKNVANAFCRYNKKNDLSKVNYVLIALVTKTPTPVFLKRLK